jgi:hypothetical protein
MQTRMNAKIKNKNQEIGKTDNPQYKSKSNQE